MKPSPRARRREPRASTPDAEAEGAAGSVLMAIFGFGVIVLAAFRMLLDQGVGWRDVLGVLFGVAIVGRAMRGDPGGSGGIVLLCVALGVLELLAWLAAG